MQRRTRILLEIFGPPLLGALGLVLIMCGKSVLLAWQSEEAMVWTPIIHRVGSAIFGSIILGYVFGILPSLVYAACMETAFARGLNPRSPISVILSLILGGVAGYAIAAVVQNSPRTHLLEILLAADGLIVGGVMGALIWLLSQDEQTAPSAKPHNAKS